MAENEFGFLRSFHAFFRLQKASRRKKAFWIAVSAGALFLFLFLFGGDYGLFHLFRLKREKKALQADITTLEKEGRELKKQAEKLKDDPAEIERIAREDYGMAKKGEKVFKFVPPEKEK